jgi:hypothetical protein
LIRLKPRFQEGDKFLSTLVLGSEAQNRPPHEVPGASVREATKCDLRLGGAKIAILDILMEGSSDTARWTVAEKTRPGDVRCQDYS